MLVVKGVKVKFEQDIIPIKIRQITVGYNDSFTSSHKKYYQLDTHQFEWTEDMTLPLYYNTTIQIIMNADETSNNPEEANSILISSLKIKDYKQSVQEAYVYNKNKIKMGTLTFKYKIINERIVFPEESGSLVISSILAHLNHVDGTKGYIEVELGTKIITTPEIEIIAGQILWAEPLHLPIEQFKSKQMEVVIFRIVIDENLVGIGEFEINSIKNISVKYKRFSIKSPNQQQTIGKLFIDIIFKNCNNGTDREKNSKKQNISRQPLFKESLSKKELLKKGYFQKEYNIKQEGGESGKIEGSFSMQKNVISSQSERNLAKSSLSRINEGRASQMKLYRIEDNIKKRGKQVDMFRGVFNLGSEGEAIRDIIKNRKKNQSNKLPIIKLK